MNKYSAEAKAARRELHRQRSCEGKRRYGSRAEAVAPNTTVYPCPHCGGWHRSSAAWTTAAELARARRSMTRQIAKLVNLPTGRRSL